MQNKVNELINQRDPNRILLVDDERFFGSMLKRDLELEGENVVTYVPDPEEALKLFKESKGQKYDLCILDIMMPKKDGIELAKEFREIDPDSFIMFLSARDSSQEKIDGYKEGQVIDYVTKDIKELEVLKYKVKSYCELKKNKNFQSRSTSFSRETISSQANLTSRGNSRLIAEKRIYEVGTAIFNAILRTLVFKDGKKYRLSPKESALFELLCQHVNDLMPREHALEKIWDKDKKDILDLKDLKQDSDTLSISRSIDVYINKIRGYFKDDPFVTIDNIHGLGFCLTDTSKNQDTTVG